MISFCSSSYLSLIEVVLKFWGIEGILFFPSIGIHKGTSTRANTIERFALYSTLSIYRDAICEATITQFPSPSKTPPEKNSKKL